MSATTLTAEHAEPLDPPLVRFSGFRDDDLLEHGDGECPALRIGEAVEVVATVDVPGSSAECTFTGYVFAMMRMNGRLHVDVVVRA